VDDELVDVVISGTKDYKGWICVFVGDGSVVMHKHGQAITGRSSKRTDWINDAWKECKAKMDIKESIC
jgi:hypothetical protein